MRRFLVVVIVLLLGALGGAWAYSPYLPRLLSEGMPVLRGMPAGSFALVAGSVEQDDIAMAAVLSAPNAQLQALFAQSDGAALLVARDGKLVLEHYAAGDSRTTLYNSFSMAKSLVGALIFKAVAEGRLESLEQNLAELLPEAGGLGELTLRRLLAMRAAISFESWPASPDNAADFKITDTSSNPFGPLARLYYQGVEALMAGLAVDEDAPDGFRYQNVSTAILGAVLERLYEMPLPQLLAEKIWVPAGAGPAFWRRPGPEASVSAYCCLHATARDWVRVGMFLAGNGAGSTRFLPDPLWREFLGLDATDEARRGNVYGYHLFQNVLDREGEALQGPFSYFMGQNGQVLYLMPQEGLVVYRAGGRQQLLHSTLYAGWNSVFE